MNGQRNPREYDYVALTSIGSESNGLGPGSGLSSLQLVSSTGVESGSWNAAIVGSGSMIESIVDEVCKISRRKKIIKGS